jgi:hypothetical protein
MPPDLLRRFSPSTYYRHTGIRGLECHRVQPGGTSPLTISRRAQVKLHRVEPGGIRIRLVASRLAEGQNRRSKSGGMKVALSN